MLIAMTATDVEEGPRFDLPSLGPEAAWNRVATALGEAAGSSRHPFHILTLATVGRDGGPEVRTVVLRGFDPVRREAWFHTDARSPKAASIAVEPRVALHWYDAELRLQVRIAARAMLHHGDAIARDAWRRSRPMSRACYTAAAPPGSVVATFPDAPASPDDGDDTGLAHFAAVRCTFTAVELLSLHASGHQRARLDVASSPVSWVVLAP